MYSAIPAPTLLMTPHIPPPAHRRGRAPPWRMDTNFRRQGVWAADFSIGRKTQSLPTPRAFGASVGVIPSEFLGDLESLGYLSALFAWFYIFSSTLCIDRVNLIKPVSNGRPSVRARTYVHPSTKRLLDFNEMWHVGRGRWVMHDGMQYDPIQGQGHEPFKVGNLAAFKSYLLRHLQR